jgi:hypothetical protein
MNSMRTDVTNRYDGVRINLALNVEVVLNDVGCMMDVAIADAYRLVRKSIRNRRERETAGWRLIQNERRRRRAVVPRLISSRFDRFVKDAKAGSN